MSEEEIETQTEEEPTQEEEPVSEEPTQEEPVTTEEAPQPECITIPEHMKPLVECCEDFDKGTIDLPEFLIRTGQFIQAVKKRQEDKAESE